MNRWEPDPDPRQARRIGKTLEEVSELAGVLARISIQGLDSVDPATGKTNRQRLIEEAGDVAAQLELTIDYLSLPVQDIVARAEKKIAMMQQWEAHFQEYSNDQD